MRSFYLLNGWAMSAAAMAPLAEALTPLGQVTVLSLSDYMQASVEQSLAHLTRLIPPQTHLVGWSLGGMLATQLATRGNYLSVTRLGANLRFVASPTWPWAMSQNEFNAFYERQMAFPTRNLKQFERLCWQGASHSEKATHTLVDLNADAQHLRWGLDSLAQLDNTQALNQTTIPQLHVFATHDALVPVAVHSHIQNYWPHIHSVQVAGCHAFPVQSPHAVARVIYSFLHDHHA